MPVFAHAKMGIFQDEFECFRSPRAELFEKEKEKKKAFQGEEFLVNRLRVFR